MEHWGTNQDYVSSAIHTPSSFGATVNYGGRILANVSNEFHTYSVVWSPEKIEFSVDGAVHYTYNPEIKNDDTWPFYLDQYLLLNIAILPSIAPNFTSSAMEIDYVRVYQESTTSTDDLQDITTHSIYPNPFTHELNISTNQTTTTGNTIVNIYDLKGVLVGQQQVALNNGVFKLNQLGKLASGVYSVQYQINGTSYSHKVVKQ